MQPNPTTQPSQAAREAAIPFAGGDYTKKGGYSDGYWIRRGNYDDHPLVQAFARFERDTEKRVRDSAEPSAWRLPSELMPPLHCQVLVELREGVGQVCDVATYVGKQDDGEDRWILADVRLDTRQIKRWAHIYPLPPKNEIEAAVKAALAARESLAGEANVERVAKAIWGAKYPAGTSWDDWARQVERNGGFDGRDECRKLACAALAALERTTDAG